MISSLKSTFNDSESPMRSPLRSYVAFPLVVFFALTASTAMAVELAKVNGKAVTDKDLTLALSGLNEGQREGVLKDPASRRQILVNVIDQELLAQEAEKEKLDQDQDFKDAQSAFRKQYLATRLVMKNLGNKMTDSAAKKYYQAHKYKFSTDRVHAQHILLEDESKAKDVLKKAKEPNADFQELAEKLSRDPSAKNNRGDLGVFGRDQMAADFTEAAFNAEQGEIVGPIKTTYGYHLIKVIEKKIGKALEFDEVELRVKNELRQELIRTYVGKLKQQAKIQVDDKAVDKM
jgi:peptidyl-prolyl cis-trans isomerase C